MRIDELKDRIKRSMKGTGVRLPNWDINISQKDWRDFQSGKKSKKEIEDYYKKYR